MSTQYIAETQTAVKPKTKKPDWHKPFIIEVHYPTKITTVKQRDQWMNAIDLDSRLSDRERRILIRLARYLNLKTQRLDPSVGRLATECSLPGTYEAGERAARRALEAGERLGWLERHY